MRQRARSTEDKARRAEDLLDAAEAMVLELGGVRYVTLAQVTERAGLHRTGVRRYYASKEELFLELAERGWGQWRDALKAEIALQTGLTPAQTAAVVSRTLIRLPIFCDLLTHVALRLEGDVDIERARRFKTNAFAARDEIAAALEHASSLALQQIETLVAVSVTLAAGFWQVSHPTATLAELYEQEPRWGHIALDFAPRLTAALQAFALGISQVGASADAS
ncbi:TetR family transcriptional regulator [Streptomyces sp. TS71-3]|uniref:TetR family transcriptional regulator n=1 Tax=Streptomyces sp. TS71-3 TaxID=2733862 RepID=UPI001BB33D4F|nr:TetR family transcriptional regulator [Streptomyces sp. TS71-3]